jgi:purine-binding chemotaxis protein CheW
LSATTDDRQLCTFLLDGLLFGIPVLRVQEVIRFQEMTPVPLSPSVVSGLINLRGQIVTAIDLRRRLDLPPRPAGELPMNVVIQTPEGATSLLVDEIGDVIEAPDEALEAPPETMPASVRGLVRGVHKLRSRLLLLLDAERAVASAELERV